MPASQIRFLQGRFNEIARKQPEVRKLRTQLLQLGGTALVPALEPDSLIPHLISSGFVMAGPIFLRQMAPSCCHTNVAELWNKRRQEIIGIGTGYALSADGLWRQHSWGVLREGILETTEKRIKYFGVLLQDADAEAFAETNPKY